MKTNLLRSALLVVVALFVTTATFAQKKGEMAVGANLLLGTGDSYTNYGIGAKFQWNVIDRLRLEPSVTYFIKKDHITMWDISANVHYLFPIDRFILYPLAGIGIQDVRVDGSSDGKFAFNLGGGADYKLNDKWSLNAEIKYRFVSDWGRTLFSVGFAYKF